MAIVNTLSADNVYAITTTTVFALPPGMLRLFATFQTATSIDIANDTAMSNPQNYLPADFKTSGSAGIWATGSFLRVNGGNALVAIEKT